MKVVPLVLVVLISFLNAGAATLSPQSPKEELTSFHFSDPDLGIELVAAEPDIISPVAMAWGLSGELYVVEMPGYPLRESSGRIKCLKDKDGDGLYSFDSIFAEGLEFPNSIMMYHGGLIVCDAPHILFLKDTNGDGKADLRKILWTGFNEGNHQLRVNSLKLGLDNWIYGANGRSGGQVNKPNEDKAISVNFHDFRISFDFEHLEAVSGYSQFGLAHDVWGNRFTTLNHRFARQVVLERSHVGNNPELENYVLFDTYLTEHDRRVNTLVPDTRRFNTDPVGYFTSLSGLTAYHGTLLGPKYVGSFFAGESVQSSVIHRKMNREGVVYKAQNLDSRNEFLSSPDGWFHPVNFSNGPDGALYIVDFYRKYVEHPQWAYDNLSEGVDWNEGEPHGRIWRVFHKDRPSTGWREVPVLPAASDGDLIAMLNSQIGWIRETAHRLLLERSLDDQKVHISRNQFNQANNLAKIHILWLMSAFNSLNEDILVDALDHTDPQLVSHAVRVAKNLISQSMVINKKVVSLLDFDDPLVRFQTILALTGVENLEALNRIVRLTLNDFDPWIRIAVMSYASTSTGAFLDKLLLEPKLKNTSDLRDLNFIKELSQMTVRVAPKLELVDRIEKFHDKTSWTSLDWFNLAGYLSQASDQPDFVYTLPKSLETLAWQELMQESNPENQLVDCLFQILRFGRPDQISESRQAWLMSASPETQDLGIQLMALQGHPLTIESVVGNIKDWKPNTRSSIISHTLLSDVMTSALLTSMEVRNVSGVDIPESIRRGLLNHPNKDIKDRAQKVLNHLINNDRQKVIDNYVHALSQEPVDIKVGAQMFGNHCISCHSIQGKGSQFAPDLTGMGNRNNTFLLTSILDPGRFVSYELKLHVLTTKDGRVYTGMLATESNDSKTLRQPDGKLITVPRSLIKSDVQTSQSIMPSGFELLINESQMAGLLGFLRQPNLELLPATPVQTSSEFE